MDLALVGDAALKATLLLLVVGALALVGRRAAAAARHLLWTLGLLATLALPLLSIALPWRLELPLPLALTTPAGTVASGAHGPAASATAGRASQTDIAVASRVGEDEAAAAAARTAVPPRVPATIAPWKWDRATVPTVLAALWLAGATLLGLRLGLGWAGVCWLAHRGTVPAERRWQVLLAQAAARIGVAQPVRLVHHPRSPMPFAAGLVRPVIVLPAAAASWPEERQTAVLLHELAHVRRADGIALLIAHTATVLYWFHPLVWLAARKLRAASERACDDLVLRAGTKPSQYAAHLLAIVQQGGRSWVPAVALPLALRSEFEGRVLAILEPRARRHDLTPWSRTAVALAITLAALPLAALRPRGLDAGAPAASAAPGSTAAADAAWQRSARDPRRDADDPEDDGRSLASLLGALQSPDAAVRREAARALGDREDPAAVRALMGALADDADSAVRRAAARALGELEDPAAAVALARAVHDADAGVRRRAAKALGEIQLSAAPQALLDGLTDPDARVRRAAASALGEIEDPLTVPPLAQLLHDPDRDTRHEAVEALTEIKTPAAYEVLATLLAHEDREIRRMAAKALRKRDR